MQRIHRLRSIGSRLLQASAVAAVVIAACPARAVIVFDAPGFVEDVVAGSLPLPTAITFAPNGMLLIALKSGVVRVHRDGALAPAPFIDLSSVVNNYEDRGLLGITVDPQFPAQPYVYLLFTYDPPGVAPDATGARVSRLIRVTADSGTAYMTAVAGSEIPQEAPDGPGHLVLLGRSSTREHIGNELDGRDKSKASCMAGLEMGTPPIEDCLPADEAAHTIGMVTFGTDGSLFVGNGDGSMYHQVDHRALRALDIDSLSGKVVRIDPSTGDGLPDNPFFDSECPRCNRSKVWALGLRNPFRFAIHPVTNEPYIGDVGWNIWEELNTGKGANFGWPCYEGGTAGDPPPTESTITTSIQQPSYRTNTATNTACAGLYAQGLGAVRAPIFAYNRNGLDGYGTTGGASIAAGDFYTGSVYPEEYRNALFIFDYNRRWIRYVTTGPDGQATVHNFGRESGLGIVQLLTGPDTNLYAVVYSSTGGQVRRIRYIEGGNTPPTAVASGSPVIGPAPLTVNFSSLGTYDPDAQPIGYAWDFGDGATSTDPHPTHTYTASGVYTAGLTVTELTAPFATRTASVLVTVGNEPPIATITAPAAGTTYTIGDVIVYSGSATSGGQPLDPAHLSWMLRLHHNEHLHFTDLGSGSGGDFQVHEHGDDTRFELCLTATVSETITDTQCVDLFPLKTPITLDTVPRGLFLVYEDEGIEGASPMLVHPVVGSVQRVALETVQQGLTFAGWSDGDPNPWREFLVAGTPVTYTAVFTNRPPVAVATAGPQSGDVPLAVQFSSQGSVDPEGTPLVYHWDFGDGHTSAEAHPAHVYAAPGTYTATLQVTDQRDGSATASVPVLARAACAAAAKPRVTFWRLQQPPNKLNVQGTVPAPAATPFDPMGTGMRLLVTDGSGATVVDVGIPGGVYDRATRSGWKANAARTTWTYRSPGTAGGIRSVRCRWVRAPVMALRCNVSGTGVPVSVPPTALPLRATLVFDPPLAITGQCAEVDFAPPRACTLARTGSTVRCR